MQSWHCASVNVRVLRLVASVDFFLVPFVVCFFVAALCNRAGNYVFALWFLLLFIFSSSPNLSRRGLHSTHGVALVRILDAGLKRAARGSLKVQDAKNRQKFAMGTVAQICLAISSQLRHVSTIGKKLRQQYLPHMSSQYGELRPTSGWDRFGCLAPKQISTGFASWLRHCTAFEPLPVGASQTLRCWTEGATYVRQGGHHVGPWPTF